MIDFTLAANTGRGPALFRGVASSGVLADHSVTAAAPALPLRGEPCVGSGLRGFTFAAELTVRPPITRTTPTSTTPVATHPKIVGGKDVDIQAYPYMASVRIYDQHICGGTILNNSTILTAAHCTYSMDHAQYSVRVGNTVHDRGASYRVTSVRENRNYDPDTIDNDIAILKLATPLNFSSSVQPLGLADQGNETPQGTTAWISGWGVIYEGSQTVPARLKAVDVSVISRSDCINKYGPKITTRMVCAQTLGHDSCQGDSGGPLAADGRLIGVVSWGYGCARPQYPGVYTNIADLHSWIVNNMQ